MCKLLYDLCFIVSSSSVFFRGGKIIIIIIIITTTTIIIMIIIFIKMELSPSWETSGLSPTQEISNYRYMN
jgi:hypothetical protein